jgi:hypothetical protein
MKLRVRLRSNKGSNHLNPSGIFGRGRSEQEHLPATHHCQIEFPRITFIAGSTDMPAAHISAALNFDDASAFWMSEVSSVTL